MSEQTTNEALKEKVEQEFFGKLRIEFGGRIPDDIAENWHKMELDEFLSRIDEHGCTLADFEETFLIYRDKYRKLQ